MFDTTSRYNGLEVATTDAVQPDGSTRPVRYVKRRFLPSPAGSTVHAQYAVKDGARLDNITAVYYRDPGQFWRGCDANLVFDPAELTAEPGRVITIAMPRG